MPFKAKSLGAFGRPVTLSLEADPATQMSQNLVSDFIAERRDTHFRQCHSSYLQERAYIRICESEVPAAD